MITQQYFEKYCRKLFNNDCDIHTETCSSMEMHIKCFYHERLVAKLYVRKNMTTEATLYSPEMNGYDTSYKWRFRHLLKKHTYSDRNKATVIKFITKLVNSYFYKHPDDIWDIIDKITDDVFTCDVIEMSRKFRDKADILQYGYVRWRTEEPEKTTEDTDAEFEKYSAELAEALKPEEEE